MKELTFVIMSLWIFTLGMSAQELVSDTIDCGNIQVIIGMPKVMSRSGHVSRYEEGFGKAYAVMAGNKFMVLGLHFGPMSYDVRFEGGEMNIYNCKLGNIARSRAFIQDSLYYRQDSYFQYNIDISYENVPEEKKQLMDSILDNVVIRRISPK